MVVPKLLSSESVPLTVSVVSGRQVSHVTHCAFGRARVLVRPCDKVSVTSTGWTRDTGAIQCVISGVCDQERGWWHESGHAPTETVTQQRHNAATRPPDHPTTACWRLLCVHELLANWAMASGVHVVRFWWVGAIRDGVLLRGWGWMSTGEVETALRHDGPEWSHVRIAGAVLAKRLAYHVVLHQFCVALVLRKQQFLFQ